MEFWTSVIIAWHKRGMSAKEIADMFGWEEKDVQKAIDGHEKSSLRKEPPSIRQGLFLFREIYNTHYEGDREGLSLFFV